jgi:hypothetical protein
VQAKLLKGFTFPQAIIVENGIGLYWNKSAVAAEWFACGAGSRGSCAKPAPPIMLSVAADRFLHRARAEVDRLPRHTGSALVNPNFGAMTQAICVKGVRIEDPAEVDSKLAEALVHPARYSSMRPSIAWSWPCRQRQCEIWRK